MVDFCKVRIFSRNRQHFTVFYRVASKISPKHFTRFLFRGIREVRVRKESSDAARSRPYLLITHSSQLTAQKLVLLFFCLIQKLTAYGSLLICVPLSTFVKKQENGILAFLGKRGNYIHICIPIRYKIQK